MFYVSLHFILVTTQGEWAGSVPIFTGEKLELQEDK